MSRAFATTQVYFNKMPHKTHHLRVDSLAIMLSLANVASHAKVVDLSLPICCNPMSSSVVLLHLRVAAACSAPHVTFCPVNRAEIGIRFKALKFPSMCRCWCWMRAAGWSQAQWRNDWEATAQCAQCTRATKCPPTMPCACECLHTRSCACCCAPILPC